MTLSFVTARVVGVSDLGFGLSVALPSGRTREIGSLSFDRAAVEMLCERINRLGVCEYQLDEIIEDFLE
ncbi:MAG: hypothetical protein J6L83_02500 [Clostridia bacterium]|nr:hypothetical protein [Clostridia bacterium]